MNGRAQRKIIHIDERLCDGCGLCIPSCHEGAIAIVGGKARLVGEARCDGLGDCLGACPRGALRVEVRAADPWEAPGPAARGVPGPAAPCGCPGAVLRDLAPAEAAAGGGPVAQQPSLLRHWPVQLALLPAEGRLWSDADVLVAADCVGFAMPDFHERLLAGRALAVACPKLDDMAAHTAKLAAIFRLNPIRSLTVARMEVPCCAGLARGVAAAWRAAGRGEPPLREVIIARGGTLQAGRA
jgi:NAD-dependent dihydropyrimidine dehydrogenase PreA subunit